MKIRDKHAEKDVYIPPQATEEEEYPVYEEPQIDKDLLDLHSLLSEIYGENAPLLSVLEAWKDKHKSLFVSKVSSSSEDYYVYCDKPL